MVFAVLAAVAGKFARGYGTPAWRSPLSPIRIRGISLISKDANPGPWVLVNVGSTLESVERIRYNLASASEASARVSSPAGTPRFASGAA